MSHPFGSGKKCDIDEVATLEGFNLLAGSPKCASCNSGDHTTGHKDCPSRNRAMEIEKSVALNGITYAQALQGVSRPKPKSIKKTQEASTQTHGQDENTPNHPDTKEDRCEKTNNSEEQLQRLAEELKKESHKNTIRLLEHHHYTTMMLMEMIKRVWAATSIIMESEECANMKESDFDRFNAICVGMRKRESRLKEIINKELDEVRSKNLDSTNSSHDDPREQQEDDEENEEIDEEDEEREEEDEEVEDKDGEDGEDETPNLSSR